MKTALNKSLYFPVIILAAGLSERMGGMKPFLKWDSETSFLEKIISEYLSYGTTQITVVMNNAGSRLFFEDDIRACVKKNIVINKYPEKGRFGSLKAGFAKLICSGPCFIQNVDNPFVTAELLSQMAKLIRPGTYVSPVFEGKGGHPLLIGDIIVRELMRIDDYNYNIKETLKKYKRTELETRDSRILANINTAEDYADYFPAEK